MFRFSIKYLLFILFFPYQLCLSGTPNAPFLPGENLEYSLKWGFLPVGFATMEVGPRKQGGEEPWEVRFSVRTNSFADNFYKVRTRITSWVDMNFTRSLKYQKSQQEGKTNKEIIVDFNYEKEKVIFSENNQLPRTLTLTQSVYDPLSIAFAFRFIPSNQQQKKTLPVCDGKKFLDIRLNVGEKVKIEVPYGTFWANEVVPDMKNLSGVFKKSPRGVLKIWYSADQQRIPIKISSEVVVGSFTAQLVRAKGLKMN